MKLHDVIAFGTFVVVGAGSPGPNNTLLLASGMTFGFRRTTPHVIGTCIGMAMLVAIASTGAGVVVTSAPGVQVALNVLASAYLALLAVRMAGGVALTAGDAPTPFTVPRAVAFQFVNPKGWVFALALSAASAAAEGSRLAVGLTLLVIVSVVVGVTAAAWALGGDRLRSALGSERRRRIAGLVLAAMLVVSVAFIWV